MSNMKEMLCSDWLPKRLPDLIELTYKVPNFWTMSEIESQAKGGRKQSKQKEQKL